MPIGSRKRPDPEYPEFYKTNCPKCGQPLKIYTRKDSTSFVLDFWEWKSHMRWEHRGAA